MVSCVLCTVHVLYFVICPHLLFLIIFFRLSCIRTTIRNRHVLQHAVARLRLRLVSSCMITWQYKTYTRQCVKKLFQTFFRRIEHRVFVLGWTSWCRVVKELKLQERLTRKAVGLWAHRVANRSFSCWVHNVVTIQHHRHVLKKYSQRLRHQKLCAYLFKWMSMVKNRVQLIKKIKVFVYRWQIKQLAFGWQSLLQHCTASKVLLVEGQRKRTTLRRIITKFNNRRIAESMETWSVKIQNTKRRDLKKKHLLYRLMYQSLNKSFHSWHRNAQLLHHQKRLIQLVYVQSTKRCLLYWFRHWWTAADAQMHFCKFR